MSFLINDCVCDICVTYPHSLDLRRSLILGQLPLPNNHTSLANAVAVEGDVVYLMGSFGNRLLKLLLAHDSLFYHTVTRRSHWTGFHHTHFSGGS